MKNALIIPATLVLLLVLTSSRVDAQQPLGYQLRFELSGDVLGRQYGAESGASTEYLTLQEGGRAQLVGHIWQPGFMTFTLGAQAFALQDFSHGTFANRTLLGGGLRLTLLPWSISPLSVFVQRSVEGLAFNPGAVMQYDEFGADWRLILRGFPRLSLKVSQFTADLLQQGQLPARLSGQTTQQLSRLFRRGRARLWYNTSKANVSATYVIEERVDRYRNTAGGESSRSFLSQNFDLDTTIRLSEKLNIVGQTGGLIYSSGQGYSELNSQSYKVDSYVRYTPNKDLYTVLRYSFLDLSGSQSSNSVNAEAQWQGRKRFLLLSGLNFNHVGWAAPRGGYQATERAYLSGRFTLTQGPVSTSLQDQVSLGMAQIDPGAGGFLVNHELSSGFSWHPSPVHYLEISAGINNRRDLSSQGYETDGLGLYARLQSNWMPSVQSELRSRTRQDWRKVRQQQGPGLVTRVSDLDANLRWMPIVGFSMSSMLGYSSSSSSYNAAVNQIAYARLLAMAQPMDAMVLQAQGSWSVGLFLDRWRNNAELSASGSWRWRGVLVTGNYFLRAQDTLGRPILSQELRLTIRRGFDFGF